MLLRRIADARVFNCEDDRGRLGVKRSNCLLTAETIYMVETAEGVMLSIPVLI